MSIEAMKQALEALDCINSSLVHVIPLDDLREHTASVGCWCKPTEDCEWPDVWVHHSMDRREDYENGKTI
jgi:hypothetical protein